MMANIAHLLLDYIKSIEPSWQLYEDYRGPIPATTSLTVEWFRFLCEQGQASAVPPVFVTESFEDDDPEVYVRTLRFLNEHIITLQINPGRLDTGISDWCKNAQLTHEEGCLHVAAHEARHVFQREYCIQILRDGPWWDCWVMDSFTAEEQALLGKLCGTSDRLCSYALKAIKEGKRNVHTEIDAEATACACVANWRLKQNKEELIPLLLS